MIRIMKTQIVHDIVFCLQCLALNRPKNNIQNKDGAALLGQDAVAQFERGKTFQPSN